MKQLLLSLFVIFPAIATQAQVVPNAGFENWSIINYEELDGWWTTNEIAVPDYGVANVTKVNPGVSNFAIKLVTIAQGLDTLPGVITNTQGDPFSGEGGQPFSQKPATLGGSFRYSIATGDTALIYIIFKKSGVVISTDSVIMTGTMSNFVVNNWALPNIVASSLTPDSVIVLATSSNINGYYKAGSYLEMDNLELKGPGITQNINGKFDNWTPKTLSGLDDWTVDGDVTQTTDKYSGAFAAKLTSKDDGNGNINPATISADVSLSGQTIDTLTGYYKYSSSGLDTGALYAILFDAQNQFIDAAVMTFLPTATYTYFKIPLTSSTPASFSSINITSSLNMPLDGSELIIDSLHILKGSVGVKDVAENAMFTVYPNPVKDVLNIQVNGTVNGKMGLAIYDVTGALVFQNSYQHTGVKSIAIPLKDLAAGLYIYEVTANGTTVKNKFLKD